ncbi:hypothetical protein ACOME3_008432 [Neoechinorhynchus agilis]
MFTSHHVRRLFSSKPAVLKAALCIFRQRFVAPPMNEIERDYHNLQLQLELENSYLSDHELRLTRERASSEKGESLVDAKTETGLDFEHKRQCRLNTILSTLNKDKNSDCDKCDPLHAHSFPVG